MTLQTLGAYSKYNPPNPAKSNLNGTFEWQPVYRTIAY